VRGPHALHSTKSPPLTETPRTASQPPPAAVQRPHTRGLPSAARLNTEHRTQMPTSYSYSVRPGGRYSYSYSKTVPLLRRPFAPSFAASRLRVRLPLPQCSKRADLGLESPSYNRTPPADSRPRLASPATYCDSLRPFAASRETSSAAIPICIASNRGQISPSPPSLFPRQKPAFPPQFPLLKNTTPGQQKTLLKVSKKTYNPRCALLVLRGPG